MRKTFVHVLAVLSMSTLFTLASSGQTVKRRAVAPGSAAPTATLTGLILDSVTNAPVIAVEVTSGPRSGRSDARGNFFIKLIPGVSSPLRFSRNGYQTLETSVNISADAEQTFRLIPKPTVRVRMIAGTTYDLDPENLEFGYVAPFSGYIKDSKLNLCKSGGESFTPDRAEIKRITTAAQINDPVCCSQGVIPAVNVELKSGGTVTGGFVDACFGYRLDLIGQEHASTTPVYLHFSEIAEVVLP